MVIDINEVYPKKGLDTPNASMHVVQTYTFCWDVPAYSRTLTNQCRIRR